MQPGQGGWSEVALQQEDPVKPEEPPARLKQGKMRGLQPGYGAAEQAAPLVDPRVQKGLLEKAALLPRERLG
ncbi:hypothetical protein Holit_03290 [Hollandina sp. SP2]